MSMCCKSFLDYFTCGYITSYVAESSNSALKKITGNRRLSLVELRQAAIEVQNQRAERRCFIKHRKPHIVVDPEVNNLMAQLSVARVIAGPILASMKKAEKCNCSRQGPHWVFTETLTDGAEEVDVVYRAYNFKCSCGKYERSGLPCFHLLRVLLDQGFDLEQEHINQRWILNSDDFI